MAENEPSVAKFEVTCDPPDPMYDELYGRAMRSGGTEMQPLGVMVVEVRMLPKGSTGTTQSK